MTEINGDIFMARPTNKEYSSGKNDYSIIMNLEGGSYYCRDSKK